ncbi:MAG: YdcF family protein [Nocardioides sp.]
MRDKPAYSDVILVFGTFDERVAMHGAKLLRESLGGNAVVSGARGKFTHDDLESEAERFNRVMVEQGADRKRIHLEPDATNTIENVQLSLALAENADLPRRSWTLVCRELQSRRTFLTFRRWSDAPALSLPAPDTIDHPIYGGPEGNVRRLLQELETISHYVDLQRLPPTTIPEPVEQAAESLRSWLRRQG